MPSLILQKDIENRILIVNPTIKIIGKYINTSINPTCMCLTCDYGINGEWAPNIRSILKGNKCPNCAGNRKPTYVELINCFNKKHDNKYTYPKVKYVNNNTHIIITCPKHGDFLQIPKDHKNGSGCPTCVGLDKWTLKDLIKSGFSIHGNDIDFSLVHNIKNMKTKLPLKCNIDKTHPIFYKNIIKLIHAEQGCPYCNESRGERKIRVILQNNNIEYIKEHKFIDCKNPITNHKLRFDFYLPMYNTCIEYDGAFHYSPEFLNNMKFKSSTKWKSLHTHEQYVKHLYRDNIKNEFCKNNNIKLLRIDFWNYDKIEIILNKLYN